MITIEPDNDVPLPEGKRASGSPDKLPGYMAAAAATAKKLGLDTSPTTEDKEIAAKLTLAYADNPDNASRQVTPKRASTLTPAALVLTHDILERYGHSIAESAVQIRHMVTNKLVQETEHPDARIRLKALELLGKHSDVGLFTEKSEVTVTHQTTDDLRDRLRGKLTKLIAGQTEEAVVMDGEVLDVDAELGLTPDSAPGNEEEESSVDNCPPPKLRVVPTSWEEAPATPEGETT